MRTCLRKVSIVKVPCDIPLLREGCSDPSRCSTFVASGSSFAHGNSGGLVQPLDGNGKKKRSIGVKIDGTETKCQGT